MKLKNIRKNKNGINFGSFTDMVFQFGLMVLVVGAIALSIGSFRDANPLDLNNESNNAWENNTANVLGNGSLGILNFSSLFGTNGTLLGVGLLITIVLGTFATKKLKN